MYRLRQRLGGNELILSVYAATDGAMDRENERVVSRETRHSVEIHPLERGVCYSYLHCRYLAIVPFCEWKRMGYSTRMVLVYMCSPERSLFYKVSI